MDPDILITRLKASGVTHQRIAEAIGRAQPAATRLLNGQRRLKADEIAPLTRLLENVEHYGLADPAAQPPPDVQSYVAIAYLPTYAGAGGGGTGEGDVTHGLVPRSLIEDELHGKPNDFALVEVRGNSMEPDFSHGDVLLVDKRDRNPVQAGPFALWHNDSYMVRNVETTREGLRIFPSNGTYSEDRISSDDEVVSIFGRPVWYGRRL